MIAHVDRSANFYLFAVGLSLLIHFALFSFVDGSMHVLFQTHAVNQDPDVFFQFLWSDPFEASNDKVGISGELDQRGLLRAEDNDLAGRLREEVKERASESETSEYSKKELDERAKYVQSQLKTVNEMDLGSMLPQGVQVTASDLEKIFPPIQLSLVPDYLRQMRSKIGGIWMERIAHRKFASGQATLEFQVEADGSLTHVKSLQVSGGRGFEASCADAVRRASPLGPLPFDVVSEDGRRFLTVRLSFFLKEV